MSTKGPDANKVFVGGLNRNTTSDALKNYFAAFGSVKDASVVIDRTSGKSRGFGFCLFDKAAPQSVLHPITEHIIDGAPVAVKLYEGAPAPVAEVATPQKSYGNRKSGRTPPPTGYSSSGYSTSRVR